MMERLRQRRDASAAPAKPEVMEAMLRVQTMAADAGLAVYLTVQRALEAIALAWAWHRERAERGLSQWQIPAPSSAIAAQTAEQYRRIARPWGWRVT